MQPRAWLALGAILAGLSVAAGAFGAHYLERDDRFTPQKREQFETGARYQMYHALGLIAVGALAQRGGQNRRALNAAGWFFLAGSVLFSGMLYVFVLAGIRVVHLVPIGGVSFLIGWGALAYGAASLPNQSS